MYSFKDVHKRYGLRTIALRRLNMEIRDGEFLVLYGPAGAGKTTILNLIAGITKPTTGDILRGGQSVAHLPPEARSAAMAFENYALYSHLSVADNLAFPLKAAGLSAADIKKRVGEIADVLGIPHVLDRRPGFLSGGQRQRVSLGRAIIRPADIYLLDEPIGHLDAKLRHQMRAELKALADDMKATIVFTTTSSKEALALGDRIAVLEQGRLEQIGTPEELYRAPQNTFVGSFIGDPPMSFLSVTPEGGRLRTRDGVALMALPSNLPQAGKVQVGVRSSAIALTDVGAQGAIQTRVSVVEHLGHSNIAVVKVGEDEISVTLPAEERLSPGTAVGLRIDPERLHVFADAKAVEMEGA